MKNPKAFIGALVVALLLTFMQCRYVTQREKDLLYQSEGLPTLVANRDIPADMKLDETMFDVVDVPREFRQPGALESVEDILGQITSNPILQGEQAVSTKLVGAKEAGLAYYVPSKMRAVAVAVDEFNAVGGHIKPGNYVDVVGTFDFGDGEHSDMRTVTLFQNIWVLSVGGDTGAPAAINLVEGEDGELYPEPESQGVDISGRTVTLAAYPDEAQKLILAQELGAIHLTLRSLWDNEKVADLSYADIHNTLGVPQRVRTRTRARWEVIRTGGF